MIRVSNAQQMPVRPIPSAFEQPAASAASAAHRPSALARRAEIDTRFRKVETPAGNTGVVIDDIDLCDSSDSAEFINVWNMSGTGETDRQDGDLPETSLEQNAALRLKTYGHWRPDSAGSAASEAPQQRAEIPPSHVSVINFVSPQGIVEPALHRAD
jgi:hypothetical protein